MDTYRGVSRAGSRDPRAGFTLIEALVVVAVIILILAILLPAVQFARESARRGACANNLRQLGIAINAYQSNHRMFPRGATCQGFSIHLAILPFLDQTALYNSINLDGSDVQGEAHTINRTAAMTQLAGFLCPSDFGSQSEASHAWTNYAGCMGFGYQKGGGSNGFFESPSAGCVRPAITPQRVTDGSSHTVAMSEWLLPLPLVRDPKRSVFQLPPSGSFDNFVSMCHNVDTRSTPFTSIVKGTLWLYGSPGWTLYNHTLPINDHSCLENDFDAAAWTATSLHPGGVNVVLADGHARFVSERIAPSLRRALSTRSGREVVSDDF